MQNESVSEFFKLNPIDKKTLFWLMDNKPDGIEAWLKFISKQYKKVKIDPEKLFKEIELELA
jgi:hypothetical protein